MISVLWELSKMGQGLDNAGHGSMLHFAYMDEKKWIAVAFGLALGMGLGFYGCAFIG